MKWVPMIMKKTIDNISIGSVLPMLAMLTFVSTHAAAQPVKAALVRSADEPARNVVNFSVTTPGGSAHIYTVPTGKLLVIERVSCHSLLPGTQFYLSAYTPGPLTDATEMGIAANAVAGPVTQSARFYAKSSQRVEVLSGAGLVIYIQGYLIDANP